MSFLVGQGLSKSYGDLPVFSDVNISLNKGEILLIAGENGAGKSTLLKIIAGQISNDKGSITLNNKRLPPSHTLLIKKYDGIELVNQLPSLSLLKTVEDHIFWELKNYSTITQEKEKIKILKSCNLEEKATNKTQTLSGGELQRLAIALALCKNPKLILLDEPFSHLDQESVIKLLDTLLYLKKKKSIGIIISTHHIRDMAQMAENVLCLGNGIIPKQSHIKRIIDQPESLAEVKLLGIVNELTPIQSKKLGLNSSSPNKKEVIRPQDIHLIKNGPYPIENIVYFDNLAHYKVKYQDGFLWATDTNCFFTLREKVNISINKNKVLLLSP